eukprot:scaffold15504_cov56-Phaeocystis_antarctica.AAC.3
MGGNQLAQRAVRDVVREDEGLCWVVNGDVVREVTTPIQAPASACAGRGPSSPNPAPNPRVSAWSGVRRSRPMEQ